MLMIIGGAGSLAVVALLTLVAWGIWPPAEPVKIAIAPEHFIKVVPAAEKDRPPADEQLKSKPVQPPPEEKVPVEPPEEPPAPAERKPRPSLRPDAPKITLNVDSGKLTPQPAGEAMRMELAGHSGPLRAAAFSHDGRWLATGADDQTVRLWDLQESKPAGALRGFPRSVQAIAFSDDGRRLAFSGAGYSTNVVCVWDLKEQTLEAAFTLEEDVSPSGVKALVFSPNHKLLACAGTGAVRLWDVEKQAVLHTLPWQETFPSYSYDVAFSPDGSLLAAGCHGGGGPDSHESVRVWKVESGEQQHTFVGDSSAFGLSHSNVRGAVAFSHDGGTLFRVTQAADRFGPPKRGADGGLGFREATEEGSLIAWPLEAPKPTSQPVAGGVTFALAVTEKQTVVASARGTSRFGPRGGFPGDAPAAPLDQIEIWSGVGDGKTARFASKHEPMVTMLRFSRDGQLLITGGEDNTVRLWDVPALFAR